MMTEISRDSGVTIRLSTSRASITIAAYRTTPTGVAIPQSRRGFCGALVFVAIALAFLLHIDAFDYLKLDLAGPPFQI